MRKLALPILIFMILGLNFAPINLVHAEDGEISPDLATEPSAEVAEKKDAPGRYFFEKKWLIVRDEDKKTGKRIVLPLIPDQSRLAVQLKANVKNAPEYLSKFYPELVRVE